MSDSIVPVFVPADAADLEARAAEFVAEIGEVVV
jgi:hypothetical protein